MRLNDGKLNTIIHCLTSIVTRLIELEHKNLALKVEEIREELLLAIQDEEDDSDNSKNDIR